MADQITLMSPPKKGKEPEEYLPKVLICSPEDNMPKIIICENMKKKERKQSDLFKEFSQASALKKAGQCQPTCANNHPPSPQRPSYSPPPQMSRNPANQGCSSTCHNMQKPKSPSPLDCPGPCSQQKQRSPYPSRGSQRAGSSRRSSRSHQNEYDDDDDEEGKGCEWLHRQIAKLQEEMEILSSENAILNEKLSKGKSNQRCRPQPQMPCQRPPTYPTNVECKLKEYSNNTNALEKQVEAMEASVQRLQQQLLNAQRDREEIDKQRKLAQEAAEQLSCLAKEKEPKLVCRPACHGSCKNNNNSC